MAQSNLPSSYNPLISQTLFGYSFTFAMYTKCESTLVHCSVKIAGLRENIN